MDTITESNIKNFDLIISDVELPRINGDQAVKLIYLKGKGMDIPVLFCSGVYDESFIGNGTLHQNFADDHFLYIDFCEKGKNKWLLYKVKQLLALREKFNKLLKSSDK